MKIAIAADHAGFPLKEALKVKLQAQGHEVADCGAFSSESTDYPDYAQAVAKKVVAEEAARGILVCSTGIGMSIAANKVDGVRAALAGNRDAARLTREHNNANVIALGALFLSEEEAGRIVETFLSTDFSDGPRHSRRIEKIAAIERIQYQEHATKA